MLIKLRIIALFISLLVPGSLLSQVRVRLFASSGLSSVIINIKGGNYKLLVNGKYYVELAPGSNLILNRAGEKLAVSFRFEPGVLADNIELRSTSEKDRFSVKNVPGEESARNYFGDLSCSSDMGGIIMINKVALDLYIPGVVQAEAGFKGGLEYFKTQAVIARTYANMHINRHIEDGYNLCDDVHCQAYHGHSVTEIINEAVKSTKDIVITDMDSTLILTPFHSNCGGETAKSGDVWLSSEPYLVPVPDPYCTFSRNATWVLEMDIKDWLSYLGSIGYMGNTTASSLEFTQNTRQADYSIENFSYPLSKIRSDLRLRSTFFSVNISGEKVMLNGRGYGHGVGLCQEGAMTMGNRGFTYQQIISYYYSGVILLNLSQVNTVDNGSETF